MSKILKLSGRSSILEKRLTTALTGYSTVACVGFYTTHLTPNITIENNKLYFKNDGTNHVLSIPPGQYNIEDLEKYIQSHAPFNSSNISIQPNRIVNRIEIKSAFRLRFEAEDSIGLLLGFRGQVVNPNKVTIGKYTPKFNPFETIDIHFNCASGMLLKENEDYHKETNIIASFKPHLKYETPIIYQPSYPLFVPLCPQIHRLSIRVSDEYDNLIDFNGAEITVILELKK